MLKEAIRAGIQPHLIPQLFGSSNSISGGVFTPVSPTTQGSNAAANQGPSASSLNRASLANPQQIPPFNKAAQSPRYLPKLEIPTLTPTQQPHTSTPQASYEQRASISQQSGEQQQSAPVLGANEPGASSLFFHHWHPPSQTAGQQHQQSAPADQSSNVRATAVDVPPTSPSPRKRKMQQYQILNPLGNSSPNTSSRSPSRGHARHRSEASGLTHRFRDPYIPAVSTSNGDSARMSSDRELP